MAQLFIVECGGTHPPKKCLLLGRFTAQHLSSQNGPVWASEVILVQQSLLELFVASFKPASKSLNFTATGVEIYFSLV